MTKKLILLTVILLFAIFLISCNKNNTITNSEDNNKIVIDEKEKLPNNEEELNPLISRPSTPEEIINLADSLSVDVTMENFSLEGILQDVQLGVTPDAGDSYQESTAYLGDSVTLGLAFFENHPSEMVIAKGSINPLDATDKKLIETSDGTFVNFPEALSLTNAKRAVLTFGSNAISVMSEETFLKYYSKLIDEVIEKNPDCDVIIQSITPLAATCKLKKLTNTLINRSNLLLLVLSYSKDVKFLNSAPLLKDENGYLRPEYCSSDDGIHINEEGYKIWINYLRTHAILE